MLTRVKSQWGHGRLSVALVCGASLFALACGNHGGSASKDDLALVPQETQLVFGINVARLRGTAMWKKGMDLYTSTSNEEQKKFYADFTRDCVDPASNDGVDSIFFAMPDVNASSKDGAAIVRLKTAIDEARLTKCGTLIATRNHETLKTSDYNGKKIYNSGDNAEDGGLAMLDSKTLAFGSGSWLKKIIDISSGKEPGSASKNAPLVALVKRAKTTDAIWGVGIVPAAARDSMKSEARLAPLASLQAVIGSLDFSSGLSVDVNMDLGAEADAKALNEMATQQLAQIKKSPQVMMLGVAAMLDPIKSEAKGMSFHVSAVYNQQQVDDMVARVQGLMKSFGASLGASMGGGMGGPGMGGPPPSMMAPPPGMPAMPAPSMAPPTGSPPPPGSLSPGKLAPPSAK